MRVVPNTTMLAGKTACLVFFVLFFIGGCAQVKKASVTELLNEKVLTQEIAEKRKALITNVQYKLFIDLTQKNQQYSGKQEILFKLARTEDILLDFQGGEIATASVNGIKVELRRGPTFVLLPREHLKQGENAVHLEFTHKYSQAGSGLHYFRDPEDSNVYMYTDFEPFDASRFAPFFDQPDLKATLNLSVKADKNWVVVSNMPSQEVLGDEQNKTWTFFRTAAVSTYLYALMAGPYVSFQDQYKNIPLKIYARKSLAKYVPHTEWFAITKQGFAFFEGFFGIDYPFTKYDQLVVPEFNSGAMENVGAVTFSERYIRRGSYSRLERLSLYNTVLHELAHMWFGNLVTMKWWNDLWLNESFATYMASLALIEATQFKEAWNNFRSYKESAYYQDQSITTHPISTPVLNTNEAFANFDAITYGKGASVMKELSFYLGSEVFQKSLQMYFKTHAYQNTTLFDFVSAFEKVTQKDMMPWFTQWIQSTGVDTVTQSIHCEFEKTNVALKFSEGSRPHALKIAGFKNTNGKVIKTHESDFIYNPSMKNLVISQELRNITVQQGCPDFVYANYEDHAYIKVELDKASVAFLEKNINLFSDTMMRISLWSNLWQMVRDQKLKVQFFSDLALKSFEQESSLEILNYLGQKTVGLGRGAFDSVYYYWPQETELQKSEFQEVTKLYESVLNLRMKKEDGDLNKFFLDAYAQSVNSIQGAVNVFGLLTRMRDPDQRWKALGVLCRENYADIDSLLKAELNRDKSETAIKNSLSCRARRPSLVMKKELLGKLTATEMSYTADEVSHVAHNLFPSKHRAMIKSFNQEIYMAIKNSWPKLGEHYQKNLASGLAPTFCDSAASAQLENMLAANKELPKTIAKPLLSKLDEDKRCVAIRKYNQSILNTTH